MTLLEWEKRLRGWRQEFRSGATLGLKAMRGLLNKELWGEVEREGIEALTAEDGVEELIRRVRCSLLRKGVFLQQQRREEYEKAAPRAFGEKMDAYTHRRTEDRKRLAEALGYGEDEVHLAVNDRLHGFDILEGAGVTPLEKR